MTSRTWLTAADAAAAVHDELARGDRDFALRIIARALSELESLTDPDDIAEFLARPRTTGDTRWDTLLAGAVDGWD